MKFLSRNSLAMAVALGISIPLAAHATNGMFGIGYGAKGTGMGGAGVAYPQDAMAVAYNPASIQAVGQARFDVTLEAFSPPRAIYHDSGMFDGPGGAHASVRSEGNLFILPALGMVMADTEEDLAFGFAMVGAGLGTSYNYNFFDTGQNGTAYDRVGVFLMQMQMLPTAAYKLDEHNTVGMSFVIAAQKFRAWGLEDFADPALAFSNQPENLTNRNDDWSTGFGARLGWFGQFFDKSLSLGVLYAPKVKMQKFEKYKGLFANSGEFDIPENYTIGLAYKVTPSVDVAFDVGKILWSEVPSIGNPGPNAANSSDMNPLCPGVPLATTPECQLGGPKGMGFGWRDQTVYKLGVAYKWDKELTLRAGVNYGKAPIPEDQVLFNTLAPATTEKHLTLGATYAHKKGSDLTVTYMHAFENIIKGPTAFPPSSIGGSPVDGSNASIGMQQNSIGLAYGMKF